MEFVKKNPLIILIAGRARSGKSTVASYLKNEYTKENKVVISSPYSKYLKYYIKDILGEDFNEENKPRDLLQQISSKIIKKNMKKEKFFIERQIDDLNVYSYFADIILIPDVRFPEEIDIIRKNFNKVVAIGIKRVDYISELTKEQQADITENALNDYQKYDFLIENNKATKLDDVAKKIKQEILERGYINE